jgi:hypothetical protein
MLAVAVLLGAARLAQSATEPAITVSFAGYDKLIADLDLIGKLAGIPRLSERLDKPLRMLTDARGAKGPLALAPKQPWGAVLTVISSVSSESYAFFPVTNIVPLVELVKIQTGANAKEDDGVYTIPIAASTVYAAQKGKWAYFTTSQQTLDNVLPNPVTLLGDLPKRYDLAVRLSLKNLTADIRGELVPRLRESVQLGMDQIAGESEEQYAARLDLVDHALRQLQNVVGQIDNLLLGWNIDTQKRQNTYLDAEITAKSGTKLADQFAQVKSGKSNFATLLLPDAALSASSLGTLTDAQVGQVTGALANLRQSVTKQLAKTGFSDVEVKSASRFLDNLIDVLQKTVKNKKIDAALSLVLDSAAATLLAGTTITDGSQVEKSLGQLIDDLKKDEKAATRVKASTETYKNIHLYTISLLMPGHELTPLVGKTLAVVVGIIGDKLLVAAGHDAVQSFKKAFDQLQSAPSQEVPPLQIRLAIPLIARAVAVVSKNTQVKAAAAVVAGFGVSAGSKNHVSFTLTPISRGVRARLEVEEGLLKLFGSLGQLMGVMSPNSF